MIAISLIVLAVIWIVWGRNVERVTRDIEWIGEGAALPLALLKAQEKRTNNRGRRRASP